MHSCGVIGGELSIRVAQSGDERVPMAGTTALKVGVLSIQGAFIEHVLMLKKVGEQLKSECTLEVVEVRKPEHLISLRGLIIPGGESTTLSVFLGQNNFEETLKRWIFAGPPGNLVWGTCAGLILLANELKEQKKDGQITVSHFNNVIV